MRLRALTCGFLLMGFEVLTLRSLGRDSSFGPIYFLLPVVFFGGAAGAFAVAIIPLLRNLLRNYLQYALMAGLLFAIGSFSYPEEIAIFPTQIGLGLAATICWGLAFAFILDEDSSPLTLLLWAAFGSCLGNIFALTLQYQSLNSVIKYYFAISALMIVFTFEGRKIRWIFIGGLLLLLITWPREKMEKAGRRYYNFYSELTVADSPSERNRHKWVHDENLSKPGYEKINLHFIFRDNLQATRIYDAERLEDTQVLKLHKIYGLMNLANKGHIAIVGSGGGEQLLQAQLAGFQKITAIEINPLMPKAVEEFSRNPALTYKATNVELQLQEARFYFRHLQPDVKFDAIVLKNVRFYGVTGSLFFSENYLLTTDAIANYVRHLNPGGIIIFNNGNVTSEFNQSLLHSMLYAISHSSEDPLDEVSFVIRPQRQEALFVFRKGGFSEEMRNYIRELLYSPTGKQPSFIKASEIPDRKYPHKTTDDRPFAYWLDGFNKTFPLVWLSLIPLALLITGLALGFGKKAVSASIWEILVYAHLCGAGYIGFQVLAIEKFIFVSGSPAGPPIAMITCFILSSVVAFWRLGYTPKTSLKDSAALTSLSMLAFWFIAKWAMPLSLSSTAFVFIGCALVVLPGYFSAMVYGILTKSARGFPGKRISLMIAANGFGYLIGGVVTKAVSMQFGANYSVTIACLCYAAIALLSLRNK